MVRLRQRQVEAVAVALQWVPPRLRGLCSEFDLFCGDPRFAGVTTDRYREKTQDGRDYADIMHVCWPQLVRDKRITFVIPSRDELVIPWVAHELGHVLHAALERRCDWRQLPRLQNVTRYASTDYYECFAEAFLQALYPPEVVDRHRDVWPWGWSQPNYEWFSRLLKH